MNATHPHTIKNPDKLALSRAIDLACAELQAIRDGAYPSEIRSMEHQSESGQVYASYASEIIGAVGPLIVEAIEIAAALAGHELTRTDRGDILAFDAPKDILQDICGAAERLVEEDA